MASKSETAQLLRSLGFSYLEIARELYPQDYRRYAETSSWMELTSRVLYSSSI